MFEDIRLARSCSVQDIKKAYDTRVSLTDSLEEYPLPLSALERSLTAWASGCTDIFDKRSQENIALAVACVSRHVSGERLLRIEATEFAGISMSFDFMRAGKLKQFSIDIDRNEALSILQTERPIAEALRITDTKIQRALCS